MANHWVVLRIGPFKSERAATEVGTKISKSLAGIDQVRLEVVKVKNNGG